MELFDRQAVAWMVDEITRICRDGKKRDPGSEGERETGRYLAGVLERDCGCRDVKLEAFQAHPAAFYGYFFLQACCDCLCGLCFFLLPWLSLVFGLGGLLLFLFQFVLYRQIIDPLFPRRESLNVSGVRPCAGELRQRVILNGHIDAAWEFPLNYYFGGVVFELNGVLSFVGVLYYMALSVCRLCGAGAWVHSAGLWGLVFFLCFLLMAFTYNPWRIVDGANDDLTGCYMGLTLLRELERQGVTLEHTELCVLLTGMEEAGLRGAKAWCKAHRGAYQDVPTYILSYDTIHDPKQLMVNEKDLNGTVRSDPELGERFLRAAAQAGVPCKRGLVPILGGATDSAAFTQGGFRSVGVTGLSHNLERYYHTRLDTPDNLDPEGLENCYKATVEFIRALEEA